MNIMILEKDKKDLAVSKTVELKDGLIFVTVTESEAISLIRSLSTQMDSGNPTSERLQSRTKEGYEFTISVSL